MNRRIDRHDSLLFRKEDKEVVFVVEKDKCYKVCGEFCILLSEVILMRLINSWIKK